MKEKKAQQSNHAEHVARRAFIKKAAVSAALAVPAIESLTKSDILVKSALAASVSWTVTASRDPLSVGPGTVTPATQLVANGANAQGIVITPDTTSGGWIGHIHDNGIDQIVTNVLGMTYQINNVTTNHNVIVFFEFE